MTQVRGVETCGYHQDPYPWVSDPQTRGQLKLQRFSPRSKGSETHIWPPAQGFCTGKTSPQDIWFWRPVGLYFWVTWRAVGIRDSTLKGHTQNLTHCETLGRSSNKKGAWVGPTCWFWQASWRGRMPLGLTLGTDTLAAAVFGSLFYHVDTGAGKRHSGIPPLACKCWDPALSTSWSEPVLGLPRPSS